MTTEVDALVAAGALKTAAPADGSNPTAPTNINARQLEAYARRAVGAFVPQLATHPIAKGGGVSLFDFSERRASNRAATLAVGSSLIDAGLGRRGHTANERLLVSRVGDALQEPFWPEGLGINRGFLHVLDCADLVQGYASCLRQKAAGRAARPGASDRDVELLLARREALFGYTKRVSGHNRLTELKPHSDTKSKFTYVIDPHSRYAALPPDLPTRPMAAVRGIEIAEDNTFRL